MIRLDFLSNPAKAVSSVESVQAAVKSLVANAVSANEKIAASAKATNEAVSLGASGYKAVAAAAAQSAMDQVAESKNIIAAKRQEIETLRLIETEYKHVGEAAQIAAKLRMDAERSVQVMLGETIAAERGVAGAAGGGALRRAEGGALRGGITRGLGVGGALAGPGFILGAGGVVEARAALKAVKDMQVSLALLRQAVSSTGQSWNVYGDQLLKVVRRQEELSGFSRNELRASLATLVRVTKDPAEAMKLLATATDLARARHTDLDTATRILTRTWVTGGRGLARLGIESVKVTTNMDKLREAHIKVNDANRAQVIELTKTATHLDMLASRTASLAKINATFGGSAARYMGTAQGATEKLHNSIEELQISIGKALLPQIAHLADGISHWLDKQREAGTLQKTINGYIQTGGQLVHDLWAAFRLLVSIIKPVVDAVGGLNNAFKILFGYMVTKRVLLFAAALSTELVAALTATTIAAEGAAGASGATGIGLLIKNLRILTSAEMLARLAGLGSVISGLLVLAAPLIALDLLQKKTGATDVQGTPGANVYKGADGKWYKVGPRGGVIQITAAAAAGLGANVGDKTATSSGRGSQGGRGGQGAVPESFTASKQGGGFIPKGATYVEGRTDHGRDLTTTAGGAIIAPGDGHVVAVKNDPTGFGPDYPVVYFSTGKYAGETIYIGHTHSALKAGTNFLEGMVIAHTGRQGVGSAKTPGWAEIGYGTPGTATFGVSTGGAKAPPFGTGSGGTTSTFDAGVAAAKALETKKKQKAAKTASLNLEIKAGKLTKEQDDNARLIYKMARGAGLTAPQALELVAVAYAESNLDNNAVNKASGAFGLFQLLSPGYKKAYEKYLAEGYDSATANIMAILPDYEKYFKAHPHAAPGAAGAAVERSGQGAAFYRKGIGSVFTLGGKAPTTTSTTGQSTLIGARAAITAAITAAEKKLGVDTSAVAKSLATAGIDPGSAIGAALTVSPAILKTISDAEIHLRALREKLSKPLTSVEYAKTQASIKRWEVILSDAVSEAGKKVSTAASLAQHHLAIASRSVDQAIQRSFDAQTVAYERSFNQQTTNFVNSFNKDTQRMVDAMQIRVQSTAGSFLFGGGITQTPSEKALAALQDQQQQDDLAKNVKDAQDQLDTARLIGDPKVIADAEKALRDAMRAVQIKALEDSAKIERDAADAQLAQAKQAFEDRRSAEIEAYQTQRADQLGQYDQMRADQWQSIQDMIDDQKILLDSEAIGWVEYVSNLKTALAAVGVTLPDAVWAQLKAAGDGSRSEDPQDKQTFDRQHAQQASVARAAAGITGTVQGSPAQTGRFSSRPELLLAGDVAGGEFVVPRLWLPPALRDAVGEVLKQRNAPGSQRIPRDPVEATGRSPLSSPTGGFGSSVVGAGSHTVVIHAPLYVQGSVVTEREIALKGRDHIVRIGKQIGGNMFGNQA